MVLREAPKALKMTTDHRNLTGIKHLPKEMVYLAKTIEGFQAHFLFLIITSFSNSLHTQVHMCDSQTPISIQVMTIHLKGIHKTIKNLLEHFLNDLECNFVFYPHSVGRVFPTVPLAS